MGEILECIGEFFVEVVFEVFLESIFEFLVFAARKMLIPLLTILFVGATIAFAVMAIF